MARRILIFTNHYYPENFKINEISAFLAENGNEVHVVTGTPNYPAGKVYDGYGLFSKSFEKVNENLSIRRLPLIPRGSGSNLRIVINYISYFISCLIYTLGLSVFYKKYDVVFVHHTSPIFITISPIIYKFFKKSRLILWDLDMWPDTLEALGIITSKKALAFLEKIMKVIYSKYDHILLGSNSFKHKATQRVNPSIISYFPNWAEDTLTSHQQEQNNNFNFPSGFNIAYTGNIGEAQDFDSIAKAIEITKDFNVNWIIVGDGRKREWLEKELSKLNLNGRVIFLGNHSLDQIPEIFEKADALFLALKNEKIFNSTVPAKLQAYMTSGKPILGMLSGEGNSLILEANCGLVAESGDFSSFANNILTLCNSDKRFLDELGLNGKAYYDLNFSLDMRKKQISDLINLC